MRNNFIFIYIYKYKYSNFLQIFTRMCYYLPGTQSTAPTARDATSNPRRNFMVCDFFLSTLLIHSLAQPSLNLFEL